MLILSIFARDKLHGRFALQCECSFSNAKSNELTQKQDMFCSNHAFAFYTNNKNVKNIDEQPIQSTKYKLEILPEIHVVIFERHGL